MPLLNIFSGNADQGQNILFQQKRCCSRNYYEVLGVEKDATSKEIRKSFIELSKQLHPDINKDPKTHDKFVKINEAYSILIKPSNRSFYDETLAYQVRAKQQEASTVTPHTYGSSNRPETDFDGSEDGQFYWDETLWHLREQSRDKYEYEGNKGRSKSSAWRVLSKMTNLKMFLGCGSVMLFGGILHYYTFYTSKTGILESLDDRDKRLAGYLKEAKDNAKLLGNEAQLERIQALAAASKHKRATYNND